MCGLKNVDLKKHRYQKDMIMCLMKYLTLRAQKLLTILNLVININMSYMWLCKKKEEYWFDDE